MIIKVKKIRKDSKIPIRASDWAAGYDIFASRVLDKFTKKVIGTLPVTILPNESVLIGAGITMAIPWPYQSEVRPRSGLASKYDIELSNSPGTIDSDFRGEAGILLRNRGKTPFTVEKNMRIAQLIFSKAETPVLEETKILPSTRRNTGGFGSTGLLGTGMGTDEYDREIYQMDQYYMKIVLAVAGRSRCVRGVKRINGKYEQDTSGNLIGQTRKFGCIIVKDDNIIAQGFNANYPGSQECAKVGCLRERLGIPSGTKLEVCRAMHAEWWAITNALRTGNSTGVMGATMYINAEPCEICAKIITGLGVETVVMPKGIYPANGITILRDAGINIRYHELA